MCPRDRNLVVMATGREDAGTQLLKTRSAASVYHNEQDILPPPPANVETDCLGEPPSSATSWLGGCEDSPEILQASFLTCKMGTEIRTLLRVELDYMDEVLSTARMLGCVGEPGQEGEIMRKLLRL